MKYQVSFHAKTWYLHIWKYRCCYGFIINRAFHTKKLLKWNGLVVHWCLYFLVLKKYFTRSLHSLLKYFSTLAEKFRTYARPCNISSISQLVCTLGFVNCTDHILRDKITKSGMPTSLACSQRLNCRETREFMRSDISIHVKVHYAAASVHVWSHLIHQHQWQHKSDRPCHWGLHPLLFPYSNSVTGSLTSPSSWCAS